MSWVASGVPRVPSRQVYFFGPAPSVASSLSSLSSSLKTAVTFLYKDIKTSTRCQSRVGLRVSVLCSIFFSIAIFVVAVKSVGWAYSVSTEGFRSLCEVARGEIIAWR